MPIYEYECCSCRKHFDKRQGFQDEAICFCPECHGEARRIYHSVPIIFKGSGFYCTDYGRNTSVSATPSSKETKSADTAGTEKAKTEKAKEGKASVTE